MTETALAPGAIPAHVPPDLVRDFDIRTDPLFQGDPHAGLASLRSERPMFFTPRYGGHWVVTDGQAIREIYMDPDRFSATVSQSVDPDLRGSPSVPMGVDPPVHTKYRRLINVAFSPRFMEGLADDIRAFAIELIENVRERGECDFAREVAEPFPVTIFLRLAGLPTSELPTFREWIKAQFHADTVEEQFAALAKVVDYLAGVVRERRANPGDDVYSTILQGEVDGRPLTDEEMTSIALTIFAGGLDTVLNLMSFIVRFLAEHPAHRQQLVDDPGLIPEAMEELMRRHGIASLFRAVTRDQEFRGVRLKAGERVWLHTALMGLDESLTPDALSVDFHRPQKHNTIFNVGPHHCPGAYLARLELRIFFDEWMKRIPDFRLKPGAQFKILTGNSMGPTTMPLEWNVKGA